MRGSTHRGEVPMSGGSHERCAATVVVACAAPCNGLDSGSRVGENLFSYVYRRRVGVGVGVRGLGSVRSSEKKAGEEGVGLGLVRRNQTKVLLPGPKADTEYVDSSCDNFA